MKLKSPMPAIGCVLAAAMLGIESVTWADEPPPLPVLSSVRGSSRLPGKFVWADLVTDDLAAVQKFYGPLFNWTFRDLGGYIVVSTDDRPLCGMFYRARPANKLQARPRWFGYLSVNSVEQAQRAVIKAGGRVLAAPRNLPKRGEQAIFSDGEDVLFGVMKSSSGDPPDLLAEPGEWIWIQLLSRDAKKAAEFYRAVGGYEVIENPADNRLSDFVLSSKGYARATVRTIPPAKEQIQPNWLLFVRVKSLQESLAQAKQLGGKALLEPKPELLGGRIAVIADPTGAAIGLMEWSAELAKGGR